MILWKQIPVTDAILVSSNLAEDDFPVWSGANDYNFGDQVISTATHTVYRCLVTHLAADSQDPDVAEVAFSNPLIEDPAERKWQVVSATNRWKAFDEKPDNRAVNSETIEFELLPGELTTAIAFFGLSAESLRVEVIDPTDGVVYDEALDLIDNSAIVDYDEYFFAPQEYLDVVSLVDLPPYSTTTINITITNPGETVTVGQIALGRARTFGFTRVGNTGFRINDRSVVIFDDFNNKTAVKRVATRIFDADVTIDSTRVAALSNFVESIRGGTPAVFVADNDSRKATISYGIIAPGTRAVYAVGDLTNFNIQIEELT